MESAGATGLLELAEQWGLRSWMASPKSREAPAGKPGHFGSPLHPLKQLAWHDLNLVEVVSTHGELTIVLDRDDVDQKLSVLMNSTGKRKKPGRS